MEADLESINKWKNGDLQGFDTIYEKYHKIAMRTAFLICRNLADSEDIVQETFVQCHLQINKLRDANCFQSWMLRILVRSAYSLQKRKKREISDEEMEKHMDFQQQSSPLELELKKEMCHTVSHAIGALPEKHRVVVVLYYYNELSIKEIAKILSCREGTVKSRLYFARNHLKQLLRKEDLYEERWI